MGAALAGTAGAGAGTLLATSLLAGTITLVDCCVIAHDEGGEVQDTARCSFTWGVGGESSCVDEEEGREATSGEPTSSFHTFNEASCCSCCDGVGGERAETEEARVELLGVSTAAAAIVTLRGVWSQLALK